MTFAMHLCLVICSKVFFGFGVSVRLERPEWSNLAIPGRMAAQMTADKAYVALIAAISGATPMLFMPRLLL